MLQVNLLCQNRKLSCGASLQSETRLVLSEGEVILCERNKGFAKICEVTSKNIPILNDNP